VPLPVGAFAPRSNTWFLGSSRLSVPNCILIGSAVFAHLPAERPYILEWAAPPPNCPFLWGSGPHLIYGSLGLPESDPKWITIGSATCAGFTAEHAYTLQSAARFPPKLSLPMGDLDLHLIHGSLSPPPESTTQTVSP